MIWSEEAEKAISRVPFFVRKKVRRYVEEEAARCHAAKVLLKHVDGCREHYLSGKGMENEIKGFQIETCFGNGCENSAVRAGDDEKLLAGLEKLLSERDFKGFLKDRVSGPLKFHHEFRVSVSNCPNACSRPQIVDIGLLGARRPGVSSEDPCTGCEACVRVCRENAVRLDDGQTFGVAIDPDRCARCGKCVDVCPAGAITETEGGYRVLIGGKLGRHPQLGAELEGIHSVEEVLEIVDRCLDIYFRHNLSGERFGEILNRTGLDPSISSISSIRRFRPPISPDRMSPGQEDSPEVR